MSDHWPRRLTYVSGRFFPSSCPHSCSRSRSAGRHNGPRSDTGSYCTHSHLEQYINALIIKKVIMNISKSVICKSADCPDTNIYAWLNNAPAWQLCTFAVSHTLLLTDITQTALPAVWTETFEGVDPVDACSSVLTGWWRAVIDVCRMYRLHN